MLYNFLPSFLHSILSFYCRLEYEERNRNKEKKELAAYEAHMKNKNIQSKGPCSNHYSNSKLNSSIGGSQPTNVSN